LFRPLLLTSDLHHAILGLDHQLLRGEVVDVQSDLPGLLGLLDLRHARAELAGEGYESSSGHVRAKGRWAHVAGPVGAGEGGELLREGRHAEGLVKEPVALVTVTEGVPAGGAEQAEGDMSLCHGCWRKRSSTIPVEELWAG
uniref:Uncharacterized protein n=1 Tax=Oncorhynchus tshawytscha TaxID=74940 RepID=A0A8C8MEX9_ONCTS